MKSYSLSQRRVSFFNRSWLALLLLLALLCCPLNARTLYNTDGSVFVPKSYYPNFSWDQTPQYNMFGDGNLLTDSERDFVSSHTDFICIEKSHGGSDLGYAELGAQYEATKFHELDADNKVLFYFNSSWAWPFTSYCKDFTAANIDSNPTLKSYIVIDPATGELYDRSGTYGFDMMNPEFRTWWVETVTTGVTDAGCDGVFIDQSSGLHWFHEGGETVVDPVFGEMMANLRLRLPNKFIIGNKHHEKPLLWPSCDASMFEHYKLDLLSKENLLEDWASMASIAKDNKASIFRVGVSVEAGDEVDDMSRAEKTAYMEQLSKDRVEYYLSVFLIGAQPYSYFQYGWGFQLHDGGALVDYPEFSKPLGAPLGAYERNGWEFTRVFENASVWVNTETQTAKITWIEIPEIAPEKGAIANLALFGTATQSSTLHEGEASRAIDGDTNGSFGAGSVTHTSPELNPWWIVDLGANYHIGDISVFNRSGAATIARLSNFTIYVLNEDSAVVDSTIYTTYPDPSVTMDAGGVEGRFVKVQLNGNSVLNLAEVQVAEVVDVVIPEANYSVSLKVIDDTNNDSITVASFSINDLLYSTNFVGKLALELPEGDHPFTLSKKGYYPLIQTLNITSDTAIVLELTEKPQYTLSYKITDDSSNEALSNVLVTIDNQNLLTDIYGQVSPLLYEGSYEYTLSKTGFVSVMDTLYLIQDTLVILQMVKESHTLMFQVKNATADEHVSGASILINDSLYETDVQGGLNLVLDYGEYDYRVTKEGYDGDSATLFLSKDSLVEVLLSLQTGVSSSVVKGITIYPNPVSNVLMIGSVKSPLARYEVYNVAGETVMRGSLEKRNNSIDVGTLLSGVYFVQVIQDELITCSKIVKKNQ